MTGTEALIVGSVLTSALGSIKQGQAASAAASYNAAQARANQQSTIQSARESAKRQARLGRKRQGELRLLGVSGDVLEDQAMEEELAVLDILHSGELKAAGFGQTAELDMLRADTTKTAGQIGAAGTLLEGGVKIAEGR